MNNNLCPKFEKAATLISQRWVGVILYTLMEGPTRFNTLQNMTSISSKMLSLRLKHLEEEEIITRRVYPETPVRIEYVLTNKGKALKPVVDTIQLWADKWV